MANNKAVRRKTSQKHNNEQGIIAASYSGPLPLPQDLQQYENIQIGFAERIMSMAESESSHRHSAEQRQITTERIFIMGGQLVIVLVLLIVAGILGYAFHLGYAKEAQWIGMSLTAVGGVLYIMRKR